MNFKKFISGVSAFAIAASAFAGMAVTANAEDATLNAAAFAGFNTANTNDVYTNAPITINQIDLNGNGGFKTISTFAFVKFDASAYADYTIGTATLTYDVTAGGYNSGMALGTVTNIPSDWTAEGLTVDTAKAYTGSWLYNKNNCAWSEKNKTKTIEYDVTDSIKSAIADNNSIVTFFVATTTGREQTLASVPTLKVTYSDKEVAGAINVSYVDGDNNVIGAPEVQPSVEGLFAGDTVTFAFPAYVKSGDDYYKATATGFNKTVDLTADAQDVTVEYEKADKVVDFAEVDVKNYTGHSPFANAAANINASNGMDGGTVYASGHCNQTFTAPVDGNYDITVNAVGTASKDRSVYLNVDGTDEATRVGTLSCSNGATNVVTVNVDLKAGEHTFSFVGNGGISPILDYMVVELVKVADKATPTVVDGAAYTVADGYDKDMVVGVISLEVTGSYNLANATYEGNTGDVSDNSSTVITDATASVIVVINGATSTDALNNVVFN